MSNGPIKVHEQHKTDTRLQRFNAAFAVKITRLVGSMWCAYVFCLLALLSLPAIITSTGWVPKDTFPSWLTSVGLIAIVAWVAQTFIQLVLLSVIMVGQDVQSKAADARSQATYDDAVAILDRLDVETEGGLHEVLLAVQALNNNKNISR